MEHPLLSSEVYFVSALYCVGGWSTDLLVPAVWTKGLHAVNLMCSFIGLLLFTAVGMWCFEKLGREVSCDISSSICFRYVYCSVLLLFLPRPVP